jgi:hypothetical protein
VPHYPKAGKERQPVDLGIMLRIYFFAALVQPVEPRCRAASPESIHAAPQRPARPPQTSVVIDPA